MALTRRTTPLWRYFFILLSLCAFHSESYFADWGMLGGRPHEPSCVDIPRNMSLCSDVGYEKMRLPNLLDHDTLTEVQQQSGSWVPLLNVQCHPHTKLFLCSLFTPVCLESQIYPCRSLCEGVQRNCESRMRTYGYHWPEMLRCDKFPPDNDMCIKAPGQDNISTETIIKGSGSGSGSGCKVCHPVETYENILDHFCRSDIVLRGRIKHGNGKLLSLRKVKILKAENQKKLLRRGVRILLKDDEGCCNISSKKEKFLVMGAKTKDNVMSPTFVMHWKKSKILRRAVKAFRSIKCDDPNLFTSVKDDGPIAPGTEGNTKDKREKKRKRKPKNKNERKKIKNNKKQEDTQN